MAEDVGRAAVVAELKKFDFFAGLSDADLAKVADAVTEQRTFEPGQIVIEQGGVSMDCFLVVEGRAEVRRGNERVSTIEAGEPAGEIGAAEYAYRSASVVAEIPMRTFVIPARAFRELLEEMPDARARLEAKMSARLHQLHGD